jgi:hypothetical protein
MLCRHGGLFASVQYSNDVSKNQAKFAVTVQSNRPLLKTWTSHTAIKKKKKRFKTPAPALKILIQIITNIIKKYEIVTMHHYFFVIMIDNCLNSGLITFDPFEISKSALFGFKSKKL